ncbi:hypothetical protein HYT18_00805 [Candidatus Microgenomates bacterium]|nr:hypothetical protein [Candidatus Microgenomates bacterium]
MERKDVPIHLVFRRNTTEGLANLNLIERIARESLESNSTGSVGIFIETANITTIEADFFQSQIQKGIPPSDSLISTVVRRYPKLLHWMLFGMYKLDYLLYPVISRLYPDNFRWKELKLLDTLSQDYPKRVHTILEHGTKEEVRMNWFAGLLQKDILFHPDRFDPDNPNLYPAASSLVDDIRRKRQDRIAEVIQKTIFETNIVCLVGHLFITNQRVGISLESTGFSVNRYFPEQSDSQYST